MSDADDVTTPIYLTVKEIELIHAALGVYGGLAGQSSALPAYRGTELAGVFQRRAQASPVLAAKLKRAVDSFEWPTPKVTT